MDVHVQRGADGSCVIVPGSGSLRGNAIRDFLAAFEVATGKGCRAIYIDMGRIDFIDSTGLGILLAQKKEFEKAGGEYYLVDISRDVRDVLEISSMKAQFTMLSRDEMPALEKTDHPE